MKKFLIVVFLILFVVVPAAFAGGSFVDLFVKSPAKVAAEPPAAPLRSIFDANAPLPINLSGDTIYLMQGDVWGAGVGMDLASWNGLLTLRVEATASEVESPFVGAGVLLNIPKAFSYLSGVQWNASYINPSIGIVPGYDFGKNKFDVGVLLSIIQVTF